MRETALYKDINQFTPETRPFVTDTKSVYQSILNLIRIYFNEIPFSTLGTDLEDTLFELDSDELRSETLSNLSNQIMENEPRVLIDNSQSEIEFVDFDNSLKLILVFSIEGFDGQLFEINESIARL